jgi:predicted DCC family thiol-disulfide oxidoreductase YuxK
MQARPASGGGVREGIDAVILIAARIPLLWPALPLLVLTRWAGVGQRAYDWIAARRHGAGLTIPHPKRPMAPK